MSCHQAWNEQADSLPLGMERNNDAFVDTSASGYDKESSEVSNPRFDEAALTFSGWITAHVFNVVDSLTERMPEKFLHAHLRTVRRWFFTEPGDIYLGAGTLIVLLHPRRLRSAWQNLIWWSNRRGVRVPWLENRRLVLSMEPQINQKDQELSFDPNRIS